MKCKEFLRLAKKNGWSFYRQGKGSHEIWSKDEKKVVIPNHGSKELGRGLEIKLKNK